MGSEGMGRPRIWEWFGEKSREEEAGILSKEAFTDARRRGQRMHCAGTLGALPLLRGLMSVIWWKVKPINVT